MAYRDWSIILYTPTVDEELSGYFKGIANVSSRRPLGLWRYLPALWRSRGESKVVKNDDVDIFHGLSHELPHGLPKDVKKVVTMHDLVAWRNPEYFSSYDAKQHRKKQIYACKKADVIVAISEQTKRDLIEIMHVPEEKIRVIYQSCDDIFWYPIEQYDLDATRRKYNLPDKYLVCVSTIEQRKNQLAVVKAMTKTPDDINLILVGRKRGLYGDEVSKEIKRMGLGQRIKILDDADFDDFPYIYANSQGAIYMSLFEGFGIPILEAMCCGVPVLTSNCSSMPEAGGDAAIYADPTNIDEIASQIERLAHDSATRQQLLSAAPAQMSKFTHEKIITELHDLYCEILDE